jgi:hypothetical protein
VTHQLVNNVSRAPVVATTAAAEKQNNSSQPLATAGRVGSSHGWAAVGRPLAAAAVEPTIAGPAAAVQVGILFRNSSVQFSGVCFQCVTDPESDPIHQVGRYSGRTKYSAFVTKLSEEYLSPQKTQKAAVFIIRKIFGGRMS